MLGTAGHQGQTSPPGAGDGNAAQSGSSSSPLDDQSLTTITELLRLSREFRQSTSQVRRIQRGSPGAGALGCAVSSFNMTLSSKVTECQQMFMRCSKFPGMNVLEAKFKEFQNTLNEPFNDGGNEGGYNQRVHVLEKLNYTNGKLCGAVEVIMEYNECSKSSKLVGQPLQPLHRRLNFDVASSPPQRSTGFGNLQPIPAVSPQQGNQILGGPFPLTTAPPAQQPSQNASGLGLGGGLAPQGGAGLQLRQKPQTQNASGLDLGRGMGLFSSRNPGVTGGLTLGGKQTTQTVTPFSTRQLRAGSAVITSPFGSTLLGTTSQDQVRQTPGLGAAVPASTGQNVLYLPRQPPSQSRIQGNQGSHPPATPGGTSLASMLALVITAQTQRGITLKIKQLEHFCKGIGDLWESKQHTDVTLLVGESRVPVHRVILASQSTYFDRLFYGDMREAQQKEITINGVENLKAFNMLMKYAYSGRMVIKELDVEDVTDILKLSDQFGFEILKNELGTKLINFITNDSVLDLLSSADMYQVTGLLERCLEFIEQNADKLLSGDAILNVHGHVLALILSRDTLRVPEVKVYQTVVRWKESNTVDREDIMKEVLDCVRLTEIPLQLLMGEVLDSSLFDVEKILQAAQAQVQPNVELMRPRGMKCRSGTNVMTRNTVVDRVLSTSSGGVQPFDRVFNIDSTITLDPPPVTVQQGPVSLQGLSSTNRPLQNCTNQQPIWSSVRVALPQQECLINTIELEGYPDQHQQGFTRADDSKVPMIGQEENLATMSYRQSFSYIVHVSNDGTNWMKLFNYSNYDCYKVQKLQFPTLAFKFFQFELTKASQQFTLKLHKCSCEDSVSLRFRAHGIIAPLTPIKPLAHQLKESPNVLSVVFHQPYSISTLSFRLGNQVCGPSPMMHNKADIVVYYVSSNTENQRIELGQKKAHPLNNKRVQISFNEQIITGFKVEIKVLEQDVATLHQVNTQAIPTTWGNFSYNQGTILSTLLVQHIHVWTAELQD